MEHSTFLQIVHLVRPRLEKRDTQLRKAIPIENLVGVALWRLSTGNSFWSIKKKRRWKIYYCSNCHGILLKKCSFISFFHQVSFKQKGHSRDDCQVQTGLPIRIATSCKCYIWHAHPDTNPECRGKNWLLQ